MKLFVVLAALLSCPTAVLAKAVFAHFMVGNTALFTVDDWRTNIAAAQKAGIDAFALNMANGEDTTTTSMPLAFTAAESLGFKLFFSFDYAGNGAWDKATVESLISTHSPSSAYYHRGSQPLVSTFEGPTNASDWKEIKSSTGCFFIPDWSSLGAREAATLANGVADGLFSWDAWPKGPADTNTYPDASYHQFLAGKPYMAAVSPWFYTNLPGYDKNWLWRGDSLWFDRWQQLIAIDHQPEFIQIISWNDFGESHYIGPLDSRQYSAFDVGRAPFNYVENMPHDGWRDFLPYWITLWKEGIATIHQEGVTAWYRLNPKNACGDGGTTGNTASQLLLEYAPADVIQDEIFFMALLSSAADPSVLLNGAKIPAQWISKPYGGVGVYFGTADTKGGSGDVVVTIDRNGAQIATLKGQAITTSCTYGLNNFNAWVGTSLGTAVSASPPKNVAALNCTSGSGFGNFAGLCNFGCSNGYCPSSSCYCTSLGIANPPPVIDSPGFPLAGESPSYEGICSFACNHDYCPPTACGHSQQVEVPPTTGEFLAPTCTSGTGADPFSGLCSFACNFGFCPMHLCSCKSTGPLNVPAPPNPDIKGFAVDGYQDYEICNFACQRNYCPYPCSSSTTATTTAPGSPSSTSSAPGGIFIETSVGFQPIYAAAPWPLLYISNGYTSVHLDEETSNLAVEALSSSSCRRTRRMTRKERHHLSARDAVTDCIVDTFSALASNPSFLLNVIQLYQGGGPPGSAPSMNSLPKWSDDAQQAAFLRALILGVSQLEQVMVGLHAAEMIFITYAILDIAIQQIWNHPTDFASLTVGRSGNMKFSCPVQEDNPCGHTLCQGGDDAICTGWLKECPCTKDDKCQQESDIGFALICNQCGGADVLTGTCMSGDHEGCPCVPEADFEGYVWDDDAVAWSDALYYYLKLWGITGASLV